MTYKETLFFIGKCLTINHEKHNRLIVESQLKANTINWESVVKVSTGHFVFPALYYNLKKANFLHYLPNDLVNYMQHITDLNRERNQEIIKEAREINDLLLQNNITPIFLKGTGNLLEGLYEDIAERMVGDIDFIVDIKHYNQSYELLLKNGYFKVNKETYDYPLFRHKPRLKSINKIAAVELHKDLIIEKHANSYNYTLIEKSRQIIKGVNFLSYENQLNLSIIAKQINDNGFLYNDVSLRNAYDVFLLSKKANAKKSLVIFKDIFNPLNCFLAVCYEIFEKPKSLEYSASTNTKSYLDSFYKLIENDTLRQKHNKKISNKLFIKERIDFIKKSILSKEHRYWLYKRATDKNWLQKKINSIRLKKTKPNA